MKKLLTAVLLLIVSGQALGAHKGVKLKNSNDSLSYILGTLIGGSMAESELKSFLPVLSYELFNEGLRSAGRGETGLIPTDEAYGMVEQLIERSREELYKGNRLAGKKFLAENARKQGIITTPSGLQYRILQDAEGPKPDEDSQVEIYSKGTLINGTVFESAEVETAQINLQDDIPGLREGIQLMSPGARYIFYVPRDLAYGNEEGPGGIEPYSVLIYEVELVSFGVADYAAIAYDDSDYEGEEAETLETEAGDYTSLVISETSIDYGDSVVEQAYSFKDRYFVFAEDGFYVLDGNQNAVYSEAYERDRDDALEKVVLSPVFYTPKEGDGPVFLMVDFKDPQPYDILAGSHLYRIDADGTVSRIGFMNVAVDHGGYELSPVSGVLEIYNRADGIHFAFNTRTLMYNPAGAEDISFPAEDLQYVYAGGQLKPVGSALMLGFFKREAVREEVGKSVGTPVNRILVGDLTGSGELDAVYTLQDDDTIHIALFENGRIKQRFTHKLEDYYFEEGVTSIRNGIVRIIVFDPLEEEYIERRFVLRNNRLEEVK